MTFVPHGGPLAEWGEDEYHAEFTVDHKEKKAGVYIYAGDAKTPKPIDAKVVNQFRYTGVAADVADQQRKLLGSLLASTRMNRPSRPWSVADGTMASTPEP